MTCRFEIKLPDDFYQCCVFSGSEGWRHVWKHGDPMGKFSDPCVDCEFTIPGKPLSFDKEIKDGEFQRIAGQQIRVKDWEEIIRRGVTPGRPKGKKNK